MKRHFIYFMTILISLAVVSCQEELRYQPGEADNENCYGVYFPVQSGTGDIHPTPLRDLPLPISTGMVA